MNTTWKSLLAGTAALAIAGCTPPDTGTQTDIDESDSAQKPAPEATADETLMEADAEVEGMGVEGDPEREGHGNPAGPLTADE